MYYLCIRVRTAESHPDHASIDQAYVGCWIRREPEQQAIETATRMITQDEWVIEEVETVDRVSADDVADDPDDRELYEQALIDGEVLVFHVCPRHSTYFVQFDVDRAGDSDGPASADALVWVSNEEVVSAEPNGEEVDLFAADFWSADRSRVAVDRARELVEAGGWSVNDTIKHFPFADRSLDEQPDLQPYVDHADEVGACVVIQDQAE